MPRCHSFHCMACLHTKLQKKCGMNLSIVQFKVWIVEGDLLYCMNAMIWKILIDKVLSQ
jgi:hypothetical protein